MIIKILKDGRKLIIKKAVSEEADKIIEYMNFVGGESDYLTFGKNEIKITKEDEKKIIESANSTSNSIMAEALVDGEIAGFINLAASKKRRIRHVVEMGITVRKKYWGLGIGSFLMKFIIDWAQNTDIIRKINLRVRTDNERAIKLYKKFGFKEEGILTRDFYIDGKFYDSLCMGLSIDK